MGDDAGRHERACDGFTALVRVVGPIRWGLPTPCGEWDIRALLEHVIGIHEYLLLRPLGVHTRRPKGDPSGRWVATARAVAAVLAEPEVLERPRDYFDGAVRPPGVVVPAITTEVLVHTWDLARAVGRGPASSPSCGGGHGSRRRASPPSRPLRASTRLPSRSQSTRPSRIDWSPGSVAARRGVHPWSRRSTRAAEGPLAARLPSRSGGRESNPRHRLGRARLCR